MPYYRTVPRVCEQCGAPFLANKQMVGIGKGRFCSPGCGYTHRRNGWTARFWANVAKGEGCWLWQGRLDKGGYGAFWRDGHDRRAHRISWELRHGSPPPPGMAVCHNCPGGDNPACVNPDHLFLGTILDNNADKLAKGRQSRGATHYSQTMPGALARGERVRTAKLTAGQVITIRARYAAGGVKQKDLAREYGVSPATICHAIRYNWQHLTPDN